MDFELKYVQNSKNGLNFLSENICDIINAEAESVIYY